MDQPDLGASHRQPQIIGIGRVETPLKLYQGESGFAGSVWAPLFASKEIGVVKTMSKSTVRLISIYHTIIIGKCLPSVSMPIIYTHEILQTANNPWG